MYLKEIVLENFKSFEYARIPFLQGFTAITGPNGCGKSNIADAVLFVLGPKSSKVIRAGKLTDLIFNGGKAKKSKDYCKATLVFDNKDRLIPIDCDEVRLTRVVKISHAHPEDHNSYFYVNGRKSTLTEFDILLANAQLSADGYNLVRQREITRIIELTPLDRRKILDDIAGISKFDDEIAHANAKKVDVDANLERIKVVLGELKERLKVLQHDREVALIHKNLTEKLKHAKAQFAYKRRMSVEASIKSIQAEIKRLDDEQSKIRADISALDAKLTEVSAKLNEIDEELRASGDTEFQNLKKQIDDLRLSAAREKESRNNSYEQINLLKKEITRAKDDLAVVEKEINALKKDASKFESEYKSKNNILHEKNAELKKLTELGAESDVAFANAQRSFLKLKSEIDEMRNVLTAREIEYERLKDKIGRIEEELAHLEDMKMNVEKERADTDWLIRNLRNENKDCEKFLKLKQAEYIEKKNIEKSLDEKIESLQNTLREYRTQYECLKAELKTIDAIQSGYTSAVRAILDARDKNLISGIHGTVAELADVDKKYATALQVAAGQRMQAIIVDNDEIAHKAIDYLKRTKSGRAIFLPLNKVIEGKPRGKALIVINDKNSFGFAIDLIKFKPKYRAAFWTVFADTVVIKDLTSARALMGGVRLVTLDGDLVEPAGAMIGGSVEKLNVEFGKGTKNIAELSEKIQVVEKDVTQFRNDLKSVRAELAEIEAQIKEKRGKMEINIIKIQDLEKKRVGYVENIKDINSKIDAKRCEGKDANESANKTDGEIKNLREKIAELDAKKQGYEKKCVELVPEKLAKRIEALRNEVFSLTNEVNTAKSSYATLYSQIEVKTALKNDIIVRLKNAENQLEAHKQKIENYDRNIAEYENKLRAYDFQIQKVDEKTKELQAKSQYYYKLKTSLEGDINKLKNTVDLKEDIKIDRRSRLNSEFEKIKHFDAELQSYNVTIDVDSLPTLENLKSTIQDCEAKLIQLGAVNMKALDEYEEVSKRHAQLDDEIKRLNAEKEDLINLVGKLEDKKKLGFLKVFEPINENYKKIYKELSMGGDAELMLEKPDDPLSGGLTVRAQPLHKKVQRLESLSGGEQSVAAYALIFAIQQYLPSPFYLLDEPDMSLDAINAERAAEIIKMQSKYAQFIVISLRKITVEKADHIIGVTFQPATGMSEIVMKVDINSIEEQSKESQKISAEETRKVDVGASVN